MTKMMLLVGLKSYAEQYGLKYMYYVPSTLYGPNFELSDSHFIFDLIKYIRCSSSRKNVTLSTHFKAFNILILSPVVLWGDGYQKRELIFVDDAINIILNTVHLENKVINLGSGIEYCIREYAKTICDVLIMITITFLTTQLNMLGSGLRDMIRNYCIKSY